MVARRVRENIATILSIYSGRKLRPEQLEIEPDPAFRMLYAVRWTGVGDFLVTDGSDLQTAVECVEEVEFTSWPPVSGSPQFFV